MVEERKADALSRALAQAQDLVRDRGGDMSHDLEPLLQAALARAGLSWTLVHHDIDESGESPVVHATFRLAHRGSGQERTVDFSIPVTSSEPGQTANRNAISYLWIQALREVLHVSERPGDNRAVHLQTTMRIPKIED